MIVPDVNLLVYSYNADAPMHSSAKSWLEQLMSSEAELRLPWVSVLGFIRITTHTRAMQRPISGKRACSIVNSWLARDHVGIAIPGPRHMQILETLLNAAGVAAQLTTDAHLAAIAIEHQCELHSTDHDFGRFPGLRWKNPLRG